MIFDKKVKRIQRNRAASNIAEHDFLLQEAIELITSTISEEINVQLPQVLNIGSGIGLLNQALDGMSGIKQITSCDCAINMLSNTSGRRIICDEEYLPFANNSFDMVSSALYLHWTNDLPKTLRDIRNLLKNKGLFLGVIFGGDTLYELRKAVMQADIDHGVAPRISPFVHIKDAGTLLQQAGFHIPVVNSQTITVNYSNAFDLMVDLQAMGENNALVQRNKNFTSRTSLHRIAEVYQQLFSDDNGLIPATFEFIILTGWKN